MPHLYSLKITQQKRGDLAFLHIYMFSLFSQLIGRSFGKWTGILRSWFSTLVAEKVCLTTQELNAFEKVRAIFFFDGVILVDGRVSKYARDANW